MHNVTLVSFQGIQKISQNHNVRYSKNFHSTSFKSPLSHLRKVLAARIPLKVMKYAFYFMLKALLDFKGEHQA